jgi:hypothetical protein
MLTINSIDRDRGIIVTSAAGVVTITDFLEHIAHEAAEGLMGLDELLDFRAASIDLSIGDLHRIAKVIREHVADGVCGRVAVVTSNNFVVSVVTAYNLIIASERPLLRVFKYPIDADRWLESLPKGTEEVNAS